MAEVVWQKILETHQTLPRGWGSLHFLESLSILKDLSSNWNNLSAWLQCDEKTLKKYLWQSLTLLGEALPQVLLLLLLKHKLIFLHIELCQKGK